MCTRADGAELSSLECTSAQPRSEERACNVGSCNEGWYYTEWPETVCKQFSFMKTTETQNVKKWLTTYALSELSDEPMCLHSHHENTPI